MSTHRSFDFLAPRLAPALAAFALLLPQAASAQDADQRPEAEFRQHEVIRGETLWSLARIYLGSPYEWREIWDLNRDKVSDPTNMSIGTLLDLPGMAPAAAEADAGAVQDIQVNTVPRGQGSRFGRPAPRVRRPADPPPDRTIFYGSGVEVTGTQGYRVRDSGTVVVMQPAVPYDLFYSAGWLEPEDEFPHYDGWVAGFARNDEGRVRRLGALPNDRLRIRFRDHQAQVGDEFLAFRIERTIEFIGQVAVPSGILTVSQLEDSGAVAVVTQEYDRVLANDLLVPLPSFPLERGVFSEPTDVSLTGTLYGFRSNRELHSLGAIAFMDQGADDGVRLGDEFEVASPEEEGWDADPIGRVQVVGTRPDHSIVRIMDVDAPLFQPGVRARLIRRLP